MRNANFRMRYGFRSSPLVQYPLGPQTPWTFTQGPARRHRRSSTVGGGVEQEGESDRQEP